MLYLVTAANAMYSKLAHDPCSLSDVSYAAKVGCDNLNNLIRDQDFKEYVIKLYALRKEHNREFENITGSSLKNFHYFLEQEKRVLQIGGYSTEIIELVINKADRLIRNIRLWKGNPATLLSEINTVRNEACSLARNLKVQSKYSYLSKQISINPKKEQALRSFYVIVGGGIIALNVSVAIRFNPAVAAVSGALGSGFISQSIPLIK